MNRYTVRRFVLGQNGARPNTPWQERPNHLMSISVMAPTAAIAGRIADEMKIVREINAGYREPDGTLKGVSAGLR